MMRLHSLGDSYIEIGPTRIGPEAERVFALLLYLVLERGRAVPRPELLAMLWPDVDNVRGTHSLRQAVYKARRFGEVFEARRSDLSIPRDRVSADYDCILLDRPSADSYAAVMQAPGGFLASYAPAFSRPFSQWLEHRRERVNGSMVRLLVRILSEKKSAGAWRTVGSLASRCLEFDPLNEEATLALAEAAAMGGSKARALAILERYLKDIGPEARDIRIPAVMLQRRVLELEPSRPTWANSGEVQLSIGRQEELGRLQQRLGAAKAGIGSMHVVVGEPGIGKSHLLSQLATAARLEGASAVRVNAQPLDRYRPLAAFADLAPKLLALPGALGTSPDSLGHIRRLTAYDPRRPGSEGHDSELLYAQVRHSLLDLVDAIAAEAPLLIVLEDIHWLDSMSRELLRDVADWCASRHLMICLSARDGSAEVRDSLGTCPRLERVALRPLSDADSHELLRVAVSDGATPPEDFSAWCVANGGGNPYHLLELLTRGRASDGSFRVPASLTALIDERLSSLSPASQRIVQAAAVLGKHSTIGRIERLLERRRLELLDGFDQADRLHLIRCDQDRVFTAHDLVSQAALSQLSPPSLRLLHREAAQALQADIRDDSPASLLWDAAEHWNAAGDADQAVDLLIACARHSVAIGLPLEAARVLDRAAALRADQCEVIPILEEKLAALAMAEQHSDVIGLADQLVKLRARCDVIAPTHTDEELAVLSAQYNEGLAFEQSLPVLLRCVASSTATVDHKINAAWRALILAINLCLADVGKRIYAEVGPLIEQHSTAYATQSLTYYYHTAFGDLDVAVAAADDLLERHRPRWNAAFTARFLRNVCMTYRYAGQVERGDMLCREAFTVAKDHGLANAAAHAALRLADNRLEEGNLGEADHWLAIAEQSSSAGLSRMLLWDVLSIRGEIALRRGEFPQALQRLDEAKAVVRCKSVYMDARDHALRAELSVKTGGRVSREALAKLHQHYADLRCYVGHDPLVAGYCTALLASGMAETAATVFSEFVEVYRRQRGPLTAALGGVGAAMGGLGLPLPSYRSWCA